MFQKDGEIRIEGPDPPSFVYITASAGTSIGACSTSNHQIYMYDSSTGQIVTKYDAYPNLPEGISMSGISMNNRSQILATCAGRELCLWDVRSNSKIAGMFVNSFVGLAETIESVAVNCDGTLVGAGTNEGVLIFDMRKREGKLHHVNIQPETIASLQFHPLSPTTFLSGDDEGNCLMYDVDGPNEEDSILFYSNDYNPVFQCGFCGLDKVFTLRRNCGLRLWNINDYEKEVLFEDLRQDVGEGLFNYPIDAHWCGEWLMVSGGDSDGGVALVLCSDEGASLFHKIDKAHDDCINATHVIAMESGEVRLYLAGDGGQLSFWHVPAAE